MQCDAFHGVAFEILPVDPTHHLGLLRINDKVSVFIFCNTLENSSLMKKAGV